MQVWECARRAVGPHADCCCCGCIPDKSFTVTWHHSNIHTVQGHRSARPHTSCHVPRCHVHACCSRSCELDAHALSTHRSRVLIRRQFSLPAYMRVTNFCHMFGRGNGGRLIRRTAYTRVYMVHVPEWHDLCTIAENTRNKCLIRHPKIIELSSLNFVVQALYRRQFLILKSYTCICQTTILLKNKWR